MITNPVPDCARVRLVFMVAGRECGTNLWFRRSVPPITVTDLVTLASRCRIATGFSYSNVLSSDCQLVRVEVQDWSTGPGPNLASIIPLSPGFGTPTGTASIALKLIHLVDTPVKGHPFVTWLPGVPQSQVSDNTIDPSWAAGVALAWGNYAVNLPIFGWEYVAVSRVHAGVPLPAGQVQLIRDTLAPDLVVADRRMRLIGRPS
jgi:hypothetical protein